ncbi:MAG: hypothetical protein QXJ93_02295 [Candidatus Rehaiarchaeum fermentans]|nr:hypothetical protein [Candidatus Rehaiarchaeum fermentans]
MSNDPGKIIEFYNHFKTIDELIKWMKERPKGVSYIYEVEGNKDIIVVIPTADFNGRYAKTCRDEIFKGLHIIFVVSGKGNYYFNYAHNCNVGIKKALEYNPKWIIVSNDDMYKIDDVSVLVTQVNKIDNNEYGIVLFNPSNYYHNRLEYLMKVKWYLFKLMKIVKYIGYRNKKFGEYQITLNLIKFLSNSKFIFYLPDGYDKKPGLKYKIFLKIFWTKILEYRDFVSIGCFSKNMISNIINKDGYFFDETFINGGEDNELSMRIRKYGYKYNFINYKIKPEIGGTLGYDFLRELRTMLSNNIYFSYKLNDS